MNEKLNWLIFIGERPSYMEMQIRSKPDFFDALRLSRHTFHFNHNRSYHSIPLGHAQVSIHIRENNSQFTCHQQSLKLIEGDKQLSETEVYDIFSNFAIKEKDKVSFLLTPPNSRIRVKDRENLRVLEESKELGKK
jgi:hypothetical protein